MKRKITGTSLEEIRFLYSLRQIFQDVKHRHPIEIQAFDNKTINVELDIFIPRLNFAIEYDGVYFHSSNLMKTRDLRKNKICKSKDIVLLRIREKGLEKILQHDIEYNYQLKHSHKEAFKGVVEFIKNNFELNQAELYNTENFKYEKFEIGPEVLALYEEIEYSGSLKAKNPTLSNEWNYERNIGLIPEKIKPNSNLFVWWKCNDCNHEWQATIHERHRGKLGCFRCRSLGIKNPELLKEWHPIKNEKITPFDVTYASDKECWWICSNGHEYKTKIHTRHKGGGCPYCSGHKLHKHNNLMFINPELSMQWHPKKNGNIKPEDVFPTANKKYWWICEKGHEYQSTPRMRHYVNHGCPYCDGKKVSKENSLAQNKPDLVKQWHNHKNGELIPESVTVSSGKRVWWLCQHCNHEWEANINNRVRTSGKCPNCKKK